MNVTTSCRNSSRKNESAPARDQTGHVPERPEVEAIRRRLEPLLSGGTIVRVEVVDPRPTRPVAPEEVAAELTGETM